MLPYIGSLPHELLRHVVANLELDDVVHFMRVSKAYHTLLEPIVWEKIELHRDGFHIQKTQCALRKEECAGRQKPLYALSPPEGEEKRPRYCLFDEKARKLLQTLSTHENLQLEILGLGLSQPRMHHLASMVTWLCLAVKLDYYRTKSDPWNPLTRLVNLKYLELSAFWIEDEKHVPFCAPEHSLGKLQTVKLHGYLRKEFVQWLLKDPAGIEELHLGILDFPVASDTTYDWGDSVPPEMRIPYDLDALSDEEREKWEGVEDLRHGSVAPRALACLTPNIMDNLRKLRKIYLYKPGSLRTDDNDDIWDLMYFSAISDSRILQEWNDLIRATRSTLEYIILDQRPAAEENEPDGTNNADYMYTCACGPSYYRFVETVLPTLLESEEFPALKTIRLFGFEPDANGPSSYIQSWCPPKVGVNIPAQLQAAFPHVEVTDHVGRRILIEDSTGETCSAGDDVWQSLNGFETESDQEEE